MKRSTPLSILVVSLVILSAAAILAQTDADDQPPGMRPSPCAAPPFRQFDFWLGTWTVTSAGGDTIGFNVITREVGGCALREQWTGRGGSLGTSLTYYDPSDRRWHQDWVGGAGTVLHLSGGLADSVMVLEGRRLSRQGPIKDSIRWIPRTDGSVQQIWRTSRDEGATWQLLFDGIYRRSE